MDEGELNLWTRYRRGDETALEELILSYLPLVKFWVNRISRSAVWAGREDLTQEGIIGLIKAIERFDPARGNKFSTYARYYIREAILDSPELTHNLTRRQDENYRKVRHAHDELMVKLGRKPAVEEVAVEAGLTVGQVESALDAMSIAFADEFLDADAPPPAGDGAVERQDAVILCRQALHKLNETEVRILTGYYWGDRSDQEIAGELRLNVATVSKIRQRAIIKLRTLLGVERRK